MGSAGLAGLLGYVMLSQGLVLSRLVSSRAFAPPTRHSAANRPWVVPGHLLGVMQRHSLRRLVTLAIETSCDDTSVAVVEKGIEHGHTVARLHFHKKITSNNTAHQGVHPLVSLQSHQESLAHLVSQAAAHIPREDAAIPKPPDFVSVTRGPGMRSNLFTGLDTAKGLAVAWQVLLPGWPCGP